MLREPASDEMITPRGRLHLVSEQTLLANASQVDFLGLDINTERVYYLEADFTNALAANTRFHTYVEANEVDARYWRQRIYGAGAGVTAQRVNEARALEVIANQNGRLCLWFHLSYAGFPYIEGRALGRHGANIHLGVVFIQCLDIYANITSITLISRNILGVEVVGFLAGSRFRLWAVRG